MDSVNRALATFFLGTVLVSLANAEEGVWTDPNAKDLPITYEYMGEYFCDGWGAHVIALGPKEIQAVLYPGGLPGSGWKGKEKSIFQGHSTLVFAVLAEIRPEEKRTYLAKDPEEFSATRKVPPKGQLQGHGFIKNRKLHITLKGGKEKKIVLDKVMRTAPSMNAKPPEGAIVLFDGNNKEEWNGGRVDEKTKLLNTDGKDMLTKRKFNNYRMHLEFMLPFRPEARGQGRANSGFYHVDHYEMQILDSFGLDGLNNECGGIYQKADPLVNMCLPPLLWQTYDVEFHNAVVTDGKKQKKARLTAKLNGVVIHKDLEIDGKTGGSRSDPEGTPGPIKLQGHGNPLQFRNIWIEELR